jgi:hypothetical protein
MATMEIHAPMIITARLLPGIKIEDGFISLEPTQMRGEHGKPIWKWFVDIPAGEFEGSDLMGWGDHAGMMGDMLAFLEAAAESYPDGESADLFPKPVVEWAQQNADEISILRTEIEED